MSKLKIGILGGGQLGLMTAQANAQRPDLHLELHFLDKNPAAPCSHLPHFTVGDVQNAQTVFDWGQHFDIISYEWEHISFEGLKKLEKAGKKVFPRPKTLEIIKDKGIQKQFYAQNQIPGSDFQLWESNQEVKMSFPLVQKARTGGYDGKGVQICKNKADLWPVPSVLEEKIKIKKELAIIIARNEKGEAQISPLVDMVFNPALNLVSEIVCPVDLGKIQRDVELKAQEIAKNLAAKLDLVGILAVEFFMTAKNELIVNEVAPRPHNSGHLSIEGWTSSQFELFLESISNKKLSKMEIKSPSMMINVLGEGENDLNKKTWGKLSEKVKNASQSPYKIPKVEDLNLFIHDYLKAEDKKGRKMGHLTILGRDLRDFSEIQEKAARVRADLGYNKSDCV